MGNFEVRVFSSLTKVFSDEEPKFAVIKGQSALKNEKSSFVVAFCSEIDRKVKVELKSDLGKDIAIFNVQEISSCSGAYPKQDDYTLRREVSNYPDLLVPINGELSVKGGKWNSVWVEVAPDKLLKSGKHTIEVSFDCNGEQLGAASFALDVIDAILPEQSLIFTNWFHTDSIITYYKVAAFSDEYWRIVENFLVTAVKYGMNAVLTPLFTPPLDTKVGGERPTVQLVDVEKTTKGYKFDFQKLEQWIAMCDRVGVKYFEMSHLFTQWGARHAPKIVAKVKGKERKIFGWKTCASGKKYGNFLDEFALAIKKFIDGKGIAERCLFHVSDEPSAWCLKYYKKAAAIVNRNFGEFPIIDALSDFELYQDGAIKMPIPSNDQVDKFIGKVPDLWTYYCCAQNTSYVSNRFFNMPSQRNRVLGFQMYKFNVKGFLHWGYNYYFTRFSIKAIDPYKITDAGGAFAAGDSFVVYPGSDGKPLSSLRLKVFYDGFQDMRALQLLESLTSRERAMAILEEDAAITFSSYPHSDEWQLATREKINRAIELASKKK